MIPVEIMCGRCDWVFDQDALDYFSKEELEAAAINGEKLYFEFECRHCGAMDTFEIEVTHKNGNFSLEII